MDAKNIFAVVLYSTSMVLFLIGFSIPYWSTFSSDETQPYGIGSVHMGLWAACTYYRGSLTTVCISATSLPFPDWFKAVQAMEVLGLITGIGGLGFCFLEKFVKPENRKFRILSGLAGIAAAILIMIGVIIYGSKYQRNLHAGIWLTTVGSLGSGSAGILSFIIKGSDNRTPNQAEFYGQAVGFSEGACVVIIGPGTHGTTTGHGAYVVSTPGEIKVA